MKKATIWILLAVQCFSCICAGLGETADSREKTEGIIMDQLRLENDAMEITFNLSGGISVSSLYDKAQGHEYLVREEPLFSYAVKKNLAVGGYESAGGGISMGEGVRILSVQADQEAGRAVIRAETDQLIFSFDMSLARGDALRIASTVENKTPERIYVQITLPKLSYVSLPGEQGDQMAMVPQEAGWVGSYGSGSSMGMAPGRETGLPTAFNALEVVAVYNRTIEKGVFFADLTGRIGTGTPPLQMYVNRQEISGLWGAELDHGQPAALPLLAVGLITNGDWHEAIDYYKANRGDIPDAGGDIPAWLLKAGAVYTARREGSGGAYQIFPEESDLNKRISSFLELPALLEQAGDYGTDVLFLVDFYEKAGTKGSGLTADAAAKIDGMPYWNKGDYIPRSDLGGEEAFKEGIKAVHAAGGRVIVYVEPFILFMYSRLGWSTGFKWAARKTDGKMDASYGYCYTMIPAFLPWQDTVVETCERLVRDYDLDGIFLDSMGWQWNHWHHVRDEGVLRSMDEYNQGFLDLSDRVREAIRAIKPDAVVLSESGGGPAIGHNDGGWTADFAWGKTIVESRLLASPTKYAYPSANLITNGANLNELNQVFAAGWSLALCDAWDGNKAYIRRLVEIRRAYADALVYGAQAYQPQTESAAVAAYFYQGDTNALVTVVNTANTTYTGTIALKDVSRGTGLTELITNAQYEADVNGAVRVEIAPQSLMVLKLD